MPRWIFMILLYVWEKKSQQSHVTYKYSAEMRLRFIKYTWLELLQCGNRSRYKHSCHTGCKNQRFVKCLGFVFSVAVCAVHELRCTGRKMFFIKVLST